MKHNYIKLVKIINKIFLFLYPSNLYIKYYKSTKPSHT